MQSNGSPAAWIQDGYTQPAYLEEYPNMYPEVRFQFRPMLVMTQAIVNKEMDQAGGDWQKRQWIAAKWIKTQIVSWDITKPNGEQVNHGDINEILKLRPMLFTRIWNIVSGNAAGDVDEQASEYDLHSASDREMAAAMSDGYAEVAEEKNLSMGS